VEQQHGKKKVVNQALDLVPHAAVEGGVAAQEPTDGDEGEVGEKQLSVIHRFEDKPA
jgi:hypothetical protein